jgi:hypothetical protein
MFIGIHKTHIHMYEHNYISKRQQDFKKIIIPATWEVEVGGS